MGDAGFHEFLAFHLEPVRFVETGGVRLRVQHQHAVPVAVPLADQRVQDLPAHAQAARLRTAMRPMWPSGNRRPVPTAVPSVS